VILVIGGPKHGEMVDWPTHHGYYNIAVPSINIDPLGPSYRTEYYRLQKIGMFNYLCPIWVHEHISIFDENILAEKLLPEILSFKGASMIASGRKVDALGFQKYRQ